MLSKNRIKEIQQLHLKKQRDLKKVFIAEGVKTVNEIILNEPKLVSEIFATTAYIENLGQRANPGMQLTEVTEDELKKISLQSNPNAVLAICNYFNEPQAAFDFKTGFAFYLDDVRDPGNFGTIIRLAAWFGVSTVFCSPGSCDIYNPKVIQSTMGAFLRVKVVYSDLKELIHSHTIEQVYGAVLDGKNIYNQTLKSGLVVIGNEANGIKQENMELINQPITIPASSKNTSESLNAAMAASIIASEFFRQLQEKK